MERSQLALRALILVVVAVTAKVITIDLVTVDIQPETIAVTTSAPDLGDGTHRHQALAAQVAEASRR